MITQENLETLIQANPFSIASISEPSEELQWLALRTDIESFPCLPNPTLDMILYALKNSETYATYIEPSFLTEDVQLKIIQQVGKHRCPMHYFPIQYPSVVDYYLEHGYLSYEDLHEWTEEQLIHAIKKQKWFFKQIPQPSREIKKNALFLYPDLIENIPNPDDELIKISFDSPYLRNNEYVFLRLELSLEMIRYGLRLFENFFTKIPENERTDDDFVIGLKAKFGTGEIIKHHLNPTLEMIQLSLGKSISNLQFIEEHSYDIQKLAMDLSFDSFYYLKNPDTRIIKQFFQKRSIRHLSNMKVSISLETQLFAVLKNPNAIKYISNPSIEACVDALKQNYELIKEIPSSKLTEEIQLATTKIYTNSYQLIKKPSLICFVYAAMVGKSEFKDGLDIYLKQYRKTVKKIEDLPFSVFQVYAESVFLCKNNVLKHSFLKELNQLSLPNDQNEFLNELKKFHHL